MAETYKVLAQVAPSASSATTLYTVPSATKAIISTLMICNRGNASATFRVAVRPGGASLSNEHYIAYDVTISANDSIPLTLGITLGAADVITVYASTANFSFSVFGAELT
jgi:hypothetical protein